MEHISLGGRPVAGFASGQLGQPIGLGAPGPVTYAALMTGAAAGLLVYVLKGPVWGAIVAGSAVAMATKYTIESAA
jgi:hypothetical protein